jgi:hypothetical protein
MFSGYKKIIMEYQELEKLTNLLTEKWADKRAIKEFIIAPLDKKHEHFKKYNKDEKVGSYISFINEPLRIYAVVLAEPQIETIRYEFEPIKNIGFSPSITENPQIKPLLDQYNKDFSN